MEFDHVSGMFYERADRKDITGPFGVGIAFPERVVRQGFHTLLALGAISGEMMLGIC